MTRHRIIQISFALLLVVLFALRGLFVVHPKIIGETMGTTYSVTLTGPVSRNALKTLRADIESTLAEVNRQMSTWNPESEISRFNHSGSTNAFPCSSGFSTVVQRALELSESTGGAFDPTLQPLLNLWGFGSEGEKRAVPTGEEIAAALQKTGWQKITANASGLRKMEPELSLALGAIAKGYGVDQIATVLVQSGLENWFVEIGGEVKVGGTNPDGEPWKIGIQNPSTNPLDTSLQGIVHLTNGAVATSGDYRNYIFEEGAVYSHILDPRTGHAVRSDTASVTVIASNCMDADGIATALFVMGPEEGLRWIEQRPDAEALFLVRGADGEIIEKFSSGFRAASGYTAAP